MFRFEKLDVWQKAIELTDVVYAVTCRFPDDEKFGLTSQMRRAAISVSSNIVQGSGRSSDVDFARFIEIAYGSLMEAISQRHVAQRRSFITADRFSELYRAAEELARMLSGLGATLVRRHHQ